MSTPRTIIITALPPSKGAGTSVGNFTVLKKSSLSNLIAVGAKSGAQNVEHVKVRYGLVDKPSTASACVIGAKRHLPLVAFESSETIVPRKRERLTHLSKDEKVNRRKLKNRIAAQTARDRKKERMQNMEETVQDLEDENEALHDENSQLKSERLQLQEEKNRLAAEVEKLKAENESLVQKQLEGMATLGSAAGSSGQNPQRLVDELPDAALQAIFRDLLEDTRQFQERSTAHSPQLLQHQLHSAVGQPGKYIGADGATISRFVEGHSEEKLGGHEMNGTATSSGPAPSFQLDLLDDKGPGDATSRFLQAPTSPSASLFAPQESDFFNKSSNPPPKFELDFDTACAQLADPADLGQCQDFASSLFMDPNTTDPLWADDFTDLLQYLTPST